MTEQAVTPNKTDATSTWLVETFKSFIVCQDDPMVELGSTAATGMDAPSTFGKRPAKKPSMVGEELHISMARQRVGYILNTNLAHYFFGVAIICSIVMVIIQTDADANGERVAVWVSIVSYFLLILYTSELLARLYTARGWFFNSFVNKLDLAVVLLDWLSELLSRTTNISHGNVTYLRLVRLARLTRAHRVLMRLPMLAAMVKSLHGAFLATFWGVILLSATLTMSSIFAVQLIHPIVVDLTAAGVFDNCSRCPRAFSTVMNANLTFLQQIVAGDSWGQVTVPIIEHNPWTMFLFVPILLIVNLAIMNVILAVIVECADDARKHDIRTRAEAKENELREQSTNLLKVFGSLDEDESGDLTLEELKAGFNTNEEFFLTLRAIGISEDDLHGVFEILDVDHSGTIDYKEFVEHLTRMQASDEHLLLSFIRYDVVQILRRIQRMIYDGHDFGGVDSQTNKHLKTNSKLCAVETIDNTRLDKNKCSHSISLSSLTDDVAKLQNACDGIVQRLDHGLQQSMQSIEEMNNQQKDQMSILMDTLQAQSSSVLQRRGDDNHRPNVAPCAFSHPAPLLHTGATPSSRYVQFGQPPDHANAVNHQTLELVKQLSMGHFALISKLEEVNILSTNIASGNIGSNLATPREPHTPRAEQIGAMGNRKGVSHRKRFMHTTSGQGVAN